MQCPGCGEWVQAPASTCPQCSFDLTILHALDELRSAVRRTRIDSDNIASRTRELEARIASFEPLVVARLTQPAGETTEPEKSTESAESAAAVEAPDHVAAATPPPFARPEADVRSDFKKKRVPPWLTAPTRQSATGVLSRQSELQLGQKWLLIVGIVITVLAVGYFLKYSFDRNWVGPAGRVSLAFLAGLGMLGTGEFLRRRGFDLFGLYLIGGSIAVLYFSCYAAFQIYHLLSQPIAFGLMVIVTFFAGSLALFYDTKWLAVLGIVGGFLTPVVLSTGTDNQIALMTYMVILNAGILTIASFKQWNLLNYLGQGFTWLLFSAWYFKYYEDAKFWTTTIYLNVFFLAYAFVPFVYYFVRRNQERVAGFAITIPNVMIAFGFSFTMIRSHFRLEMVSVVTVAYAAIFFAMATHLFRRNRDNLEAFILLIAKGLLFLIITVPILLSEHWITVFWSVQGIVLMWAALRLGDSRIRGGAILLLIISAAKLLFYDYPTVFGLRIPELYFRSGFGSSVVERWATIGVGAATLLVAGRMLMAAGFDGSKGRINPSGMFFSLFGGMLFLTMNVETAGFFYDHARGARFASISVLWALFAAFLMVLGFVNSLVVARRVAMGLFAATVLKVFVRDMANVETPYRILSFLVLGVLLVAASYLYHRYAARILAPLDKEAAEI